MPQEFIESDYDEYSNNEIVWNNPITTMSAYEEDDSSSDNEGPEDVSIALTKASALEEINRAENCVRQQKNVLKQKRRKRCEELAMQKQAKRQRLDKLASKWLDEEVLEKIGQVESFENTQQVDHQKVNRSSSYSEGLKRNSSKLDDVIEIPSTSTQFRVKALNKLNNSVVAKSSELQQLKLKYIQGKKKRESSAKALLKKEKQVAGGRNTFF